MSFDFRATNERAVDVARRATAEGALSARPEGSVLFSAISGGHMYGFPSPDSDLDIRGCHVLPVERMVGLSDPIETFELMGKYHEGLEIDWVSHDLRKYVRLLLKNGGYVLEQIMSPLVVESSPKFEEFRQLASGSMTRHVHHHYRGFYRRQREIVASERPLLAKSVLYLLRVAMSGLHLLRTGRVECDIQTLDEDHGIAPLPWLLEVKTGEKEKAEIDEGRRDEMLAVADGIAAAMDGAVTSSPLPTEVPNREALAEFVVRARLGS